MGSTKNTAGFYSQMLFLYYFLMAHDKKVQWHYEGEGENEGDFIIENTIYESKTSVKDSVEDLEIRNSLPPKIKKALSQLSKSQKIFNKKIIVVNQKVVIDNGTKLKNVLQEFKLYNLNDIIIANKMNFTDPKVKIKENDNVFLFSIPVENGEDMEYLGKKIFINLELFKYLGQFKNFSVVSKAWKGFLTEKASPQFEFNSARIVTYFAAKNTILNGDYENRDIDEYLWIINQINKYRFLPKMELGEEEEDKWIYNKLKDKTKISEDNLKKIIERTIEKDETSLELLKGVIYDQKSWNL